MQFIYHIEAQKTTLSLDAKEYAHVLKVRRSKVGDELFFRNMSDDVLYKYKIIDINKKFASLDLIGEEHLKIEAARYLHVGWCVVDPKIIEKTIPYLNELGVAKISFVYCEFSQKNFKIDLNRIERILINSSQQCGRSKMMEIEIVDSLKDYFMLYPKSKMIDFSENKLQKENDLSSFLIGCEGGFSNVERNLFAHIDKIGLQTPMVLRSETALISICSLVLT
ncbi:MAG: 16S rRNA (uracil(1498)-N(3))-methyltransferase [Sulfurospirillaceae bacterium]|nr:16S rRNA (uracil(1498)-N(3))-methyltransferase [Sulfurospirillaceae bacterium]